jgi:hypothetical protein
MKKPHVLNRPMFNTGGTSAYGRGITSNLVSEEQRQRFNDGGRVGYQNRGYVDYMGPTYQTTDPSQKYGYSRYLTPWPKSEEDLRTFKKYQFDKIPRWQDVYSDVYETEDIPDLETWDVGKPYLSASEEEQQDIEFKKRMDERSENIRKMQDVGLVIPGEGATTAQEFGTSGVEEEVVVGEEEPSWAGIPGEGDPSAASTITKTDTDLLDTPDKWAFLDEQQKAKQKLARGYGLAEAAAGAVRWSTEGTAKGRSKAIADTLSKVGAIGAKYKGEAMDLKTKAKILGTVEEIKGEQKIKEWELKMKEWYTPSLEQAKEAQEWKKGRAIIADELAKDKSGKEIYANILQPKEIKSAQDQQKAILSLTEQYLTIEDDKNSKELRDPEKNGLVFITKLGEIVKNNNGSIDPINPLTDPFFTWKD